MSLSESLGAGDTEAPAELIVPDYGTPAVSADKGPTSMGSEPAPAPAGAAASRTAGGLAGLCDAVLAPLPKLITVHADAGATDAAGAAESARLQTNLYNITGYCKPTPSSCASRLSALRAACCARAPSR